MCDAKKNIEKDRKCDEKPLKTEEQQAQAVVPSVHLVLTILEI